MSHIVLVVDGAVVYDSGGVTPTPTPTPTPPPQPPGTQEVPLGAQNWLAAEPGIRYYARLPFPFNTNMTIQVGQGQGPAPTHISMAISDQPGGGIPSPYPQGVEGDPNSGLAISASLNPVPGRGGYYQARVTGDRQWYVCFSVNSPGSIVYYPY